MTNMEAIKILSAKRYCMKRENSGTDVDCNLKNCDECNLCYEQGTSGEQIEALSMAIDALQKQIPKKPIPYYYKDKCPNPACGLIVKIGEKYCKGCGQTLRWGE